VSPILRVSGLHLEPDFTNNCCPAREVHEKQHPSEASHHLILHHLILLEQALFRNVESFQDPKEESDVNSTQGWVRGPIRKMVINFQNSLKEHPPIPPGAPDEFQPK
jgi:hypothetical protein